MYKCLHCKTYVNRRVGQSSNKTYCSTSCQGLYKSSIKLDEWKNTGVIERVSGTPGWLKRYILEKQDGKCAECGIDSWNNKPIVFELEHKDGNSSNNVEDNLCCLCPNCHSQTPTYKGANRGNGRHARRQRYKDGKSF